MVELNHMPRRKAIKLLSTAFIALPTIGVATPSFSLTENNKDLNVNIFSKHLQFLDFKEMAEVVKEIGFTGADLTVREGGHIEPLKVENDLPKATAILKSYGINPYIITTNVLDSTNPTDKKVVATAANQGYQIYRTGWLKYKASQPIDEALAEYRKQLTSLAELNKSLGIAGSYQNHSGNYLGSALWDLSSLLNGISPKELGSQYDIMHATVDGGTNWETGFRMIKPNINSLAIKDFKWGKVGGKWKPIKTPLGEGMVDIKGFLTLLKNSNLALPLTMHFEYDLGGAEHGARKLSIDKKEVLSAMKKDLDYLQTMWKSINN